MTDALTKDMNEVAEEVLGVKRYKRQQWVSVRIALFRILRS